MESVNNLHLMCHQSSVTDQISGCSCKNVLLSIHRNSHKTTCEKTFSPQIVMWLLQGGDFTVKRRRHQSSFYEGT